MARTLVADTYYLKSEWVEVLDLSSKEKLYWLGTRLHEFRAQVLKEQGSLLDKVSAR